MDYRVEVVSTAPLRVRFGFGQPDDADGPALVPRAIRPAGYFVEATLHAKGGGEVFRTTRPKAKPKLDPADEASYLELGPGYSYGAVLRLDAEHLAPGDYVLAVEYSNHEYQGPASAPIGALRHAQELNIAVP